MVLQMDNVGSTAQDPDNRFADVALTADDIPNVLNLAATYELPFGRGKAFLSGGGLRPTFLEAGVSLRTGTSKMACLSWITGPCNGITCRPNFIGDPNSGPGVHTQNQWFNPNAFEAAFQTNPAILTAPDPSIYNEWWQFGTMGLRNNAVRSPGFWNVDASLSKDFHLTEQKYISFRWDVFNALNHQNLGIPNTNWCLGPNPDGSVDLVASVRLPIRENH